MFQLRVTWPGSEPIVHLIHGDSVTLGRSKDCDLVLENRILSKRHARILHGFVVVDLGSSNGTFLDGERVNQPVCWTSGGRLTLGSDEILVEVQACDEQENSWVDPDMTICADQVPAPRLIPATRPTPDAGPAAAPGNAGAGGDPEMATPRVQLAQLAQTARDAQAAQSSLEGALAARGQELARALAALEAARGETQARERDAELLRAELVRRTPIVQQAADGAQSAGDIREQLALAERRGKELARELESMRASTLEGALAQGGAGMELSSAR